MAAGRFLAAVRSGDAEAVRGLLAAGVDPDAVDGTGTPVLCLAVDAFALAVVEELANGARLDRRGPDGRTPLLRAVDRGAYDIVTVLIGRGARLWHEDAEGRDALALARYWHETDAVAELRRRSGASGPVRRRVVRSESDTTCEELSIGELTVRTAHTAILTMLEPKYGIAPSFDALMSRALSEPDVDHEVWWATTSALQQRHDRPVREAAAALRHHPDSLARYFGASLLHQIVLFDESEDESFDEPIVDRLLPWAEQEENVRVMRALTAGLTAAFDPRAEQHLPVLTRHPDPEVRQRAVSGLHGQVAKGHPEAVAAVTACTRDTYAMVRETACTALGHAPADSPGPADALAACLTDEDEGVRITAAVRLALRDDPRGDEVLRAYDAVDEGSPYYWDLLDVWRHRR
ncbi:HEAT repeat domain-containing protein [Streptomyces cavernicola]|uniref:HEAT repeat domain-containing protein n=1 Tax=Streptomyces cavernicola TaxID=3043613 RepID=A0ABT6SBQ4_9ACTN|nr:HEAT repeat domain-containing protein [Streptomyces sp. B-S-A6]MDI3405621.1 HEAT repeat domain-containing protein [Streptomyces sp. B-S-A6]